MANASITEVHKKRHGDVAYTPVSAHTDSDSNGEGSSSDSMDDRGGTSSRFKILILVCHRLHSHFGHSFISVNFESHKDSRKATFESLTIEI